MRAAVFGVAGGVRWSSPGASPGVHQLAWLVMQSPLTVYPGRSRPELP